MSSTNRRGSAAPQARDLLLALYPAALVLLTLAALAAPQRVGGAALAQVFAHYLFLPALLLVPLALRRGMFLLRLALAAAAAAFLIVYPPALAVPAPPPAAPSLTVLSWNVYVGGVEAAELRRVVELHQPDVVALQEANLDAVAADEALAARFPHRVVRPSETAPGLAILSRHPIIAAAVPPLDVPEWDMPRIVWARLDVDGRTVTIVNAHPIPPRTFEAGCSPLRCYNTGPRDAQIAGVRRLVEPLRAGPEPMVLVGDMNVTEREPAYFDLAAGLRDAHREAGSGFGTTWRPSPLKLPVGLIRIDYMFTNDQLRTLDLHTDCAGRGSDHCLLVGRFALHDPTATAARP